MSWAEIAKQAGEAYRDADAPGAVVVDGALRTAGGAASGAATGVAIGAAIGSVVPGIGTAVGAAAGAIVGGVVALLDWAGDLFGQEPRWRAVSDRYGERMMPVGWSPSKRLIHERRDVSPGRVGDRLFNTRRAFEDGAARSEVLFCGPAMLGREASADVRGRMVLGGRAAFLHEARTLVGADAAQVRADATAGNMARFARMLGRADARDVLERVAYVGAYRRRGLSQVQALLMAGRVAGLDVPAVALDAARARLAGARRTYLGEIQVPRLPDAGDVHTVARAIVRMEYFVQNRADWPRADERDPRLVAAMVAWLRQPATGRPPARVRLPKFR